MAQKEALDRLRSLCLAYPEAVEKESWGHPTFSAGRKTFAAWEIIGGEPSIAFRVDRDGFDLFRKNSGFFETPYGRGLWVSLAARGKIDWRLVEALLDSAYRLVALKRMTEALDRKAPVGRFPPRDSRRRAH
ncbi:MAG: MmcQ/YjbR family DNA-binding protein [Thermoanaerobaculia bacterium]